MYRDGHLLEYRYKHWQVIKVSVSKQSNVGQVKNISVKCLNKVTWGKQNQPTNQYSNVRYKGSISQVSVLTKLIAHNNSCFQK